MTDGRIGHISTSIMGAIKAAPAGGAVPFYHGCLGDAAPLAPPLFRSLQFRYTYQNSRGEKLPPAQIGRILRPTMYCIVWPARGEHVELVKFSNLLKIYSLITMVVNRQKILFRGTNFHRMQLHYLHKSCLLMIGHVLFVIL